MRILGQQVLRGADGQPLPAAATVDPEEIRRLADGTLVWSSEGVWHADAAQRHAPFIRLVQADGTPLRDLRLPPQFALDDNRGHGGQARRCALGSE